MKVNTALVCILAILLSYKDRRGHRGRDRMVRCTTLCDQVCQ